MTTSHPNSIALSPGLPAQDEARLEELSTFFQCTESEALLRSIRFAHKAICAGPDALGRRDILKSVAAKGPELEPTAA